jgi:hypothetical protein
MRAEIRAHAFLRIEIGVEDAIKLRDHLDDTVDTTIAEAPLVELLEQLNEFVPAGY